MRVVEAVDEVEDDSEALPVEERAALEDRPDADPDALQRDTDDNEPDATEDVAADPAWRLAAVLLPAGAGLAALITLAQTVSGELDAATGYVAALALAVLCAGSWRDAARRARRGRWVRVEVHEYGWPLGLLLVALALAARGASIITYAPALVALLPVTWQIAHLPPLHRVTTMLPRALPMLESTEAPHDGSAHGDEEVRRIVGEVVDRLPPDITERLEGWTIEVQRRAEDELPGTVIFGQCFYNARVIAIYDRPHLRYHRRGDDLREAVTYTVLHEVAHALGLDEVGVRRLGWLADSAVSPESS